MEPVFADIALDHKLGGVVWPTTEVSKSLRLPFQPSLLLRSNL